MLTKLSINKSKISLLKSNLFNFNKFLGNKRLYNFSATNSQLDDKTKNELVNENLNQHLNTIQKKIKNEPFIKNLFCGKYIFDYLNYPEYDSNAELNQLNKSYIEPTRDYFQKQTHVNIVSNNGEFTSDAINKFNSLSLYSSSFPKNYGGYELDSTILTRVIEEMGVFPSLAVNYIYSNEIAAKCILLFGSSEQKSKYLNKISSGEAKACYCYSEPDNGSDPARFNVIATVDKNSKNSEIEYVLNGKKSWIASLSNHSEKNDLVFIVICKTLENENKECINAFLIEKSTEGVEMNKIVSNNDGLNLYEVNFNNVKVSKQNLLGLAGMGFEIGNKVLENSRFLVGAICVGLLKDLLKETTSFCINSKRFGKSLSEFPIIKEKIAQVETAIYTMESMTYFTAGIVDSYEIPDIGSESALTKIFCTEKLKPCIDNCLEIFGLGAYKSLDQFKRKTLLDTSFLSTMLNTNDYLRLYVSTNGIILSGLEVGEDLRKIRNPFMYPFFIIKQILTNLKLARSANKDVPEYLYLWEHVHPSLVQAARFLEQSSIRFMMAVKSVMVYYGGNAVDYQSQNNMKKLADMAMEIYALNCSIARASRSYSIGLPNCQHELSLVLLQANKTHLNVKLCFEDIIKSNGGVGLDNTINNVAEHVFKSKGHGSTHSISRNY